MSGTMTARRNELGVHEYKSIMMQRTAKENAACLRRLICKRSDQPKIERIACKLIADSPSAFSGFVNINRPADYFTT